MMEKVKTIGESLREAEIDAGAEALRLHQQGSRVTVQWAQLPNSSKRKWRDAAAAVLHAARPL